MKSDRDSTRIIRSWLEDGVTVLPDRVLDAVEESLHATPQRRAGWLSRLFPTRGSNRLRFGFAAVIVVAAILGGLSVLPRKVGGPPAPTASPTASTLTLASGTFTAQFGAADIGATALGSTIPGQATPTWIMSGELEVTNDGGRFLVDLQCARTDGDGLTSIGGDIAESTHEDAVEGERVAIVFEPGSPVRSVLWFESERRAPSCDQFLDGAPAVVEFLEPIEGEVELRPVPSPMETPTELGAGGQNLEAGLYTLTEEFPVSLTFAVPDGWDNCSAGPREQGVCPSGSAGVSRGISFLIVANVVAEPCRRALMDPPVGPTVDDLVAAIVGLEGFESTTPVDVTVDGYSGKELEVTAPARPPCQLETWATSSRTNGVAPGEHNLLRIIDVAGTRVMIAAAFPGSITAEERSEILQIVDSISIE